jgi:peroxiredoxin
MTSIPDSKFVNRVDGEFQTVSATKLFEGKRVVVFGLPGAFTPTCSEQQLPGFDTKYNEFTAAGIDAVYCVSVNDGFVMNAWAKELGILNVQLLADGWQLTN